MTFAKVPLLLETSILMLAVFIFLFIVILIDTRRVTKKIKRLEDARLARQMEAPIGDGEFMESFF